jgi:flavin-dependent dehydrogenase
MYCLIECDHVLFGAKANGCCHLQIDMPGGVVVLGDAAASFNPIYGQGMTVGVKGAILLRDLLQKHLGGRKFSADHRDIFLKDFGKVLFDATLVLLV